MSEEASVEKIPPTEDKAVASSSEPDLSIECAVCLQPCVYPVQLPCKHIFCFLCVKGVTTQSKRCAMCRREIPPDYLLNPELLSKVEPEGGGGFQEGGECWQWFYEGRNGWWVYDERTSQEVEMHYKSGDKRCELLIAGFLYIIDFEHMLQYRRNDPSRRRRVKKDVASGPKKGVAGLRIEQEAGEDTGTAVTVDAADNTNDSGIAQAMNSLAISTQPEDNETGGTSGQGQDVVVGSDMPVTESDD